MKINGGSMKYLLLCLLFVGCSKAPPKLKVGDCVSNPIIHKAVVVEVSSMFESYRYVLYKDVVVEVSSTVELYRTEQIIMYEQDLELNDYKKVECPK